MAPTLVEEQVHVTCVLEHDVCAECWSDAGHSLPAQPSATQMFLVQSYWLRKLRCSKIAEAEAAVSVNKTQWLVMHICMCSKLRICIAVRVVK
jgi:hypothetical protein